MAKKSNNRFILILNIFFEGISLYCRNLDTFIKYMFFPVLGQILGLFVIFAINYLLVLHLPEIISKYPVFDNILLVLTLLLICVFPGFMIFCKAFYDLLIAYGSLNSMVAVSRGGRMRNKPLDTKTHDNILKKRLVSYIILWLILTLIILVGTFPLFIIVFGAVAVFLVFVFQVFMLEDVSPISAIKRSIYLVKGNYLATSFLILLSVLLTYYTIPLLFVWLSAKINLTQYLALPVNAYINKLAVPAVTTAVENAIETVNLNGYNLSFSVKSFFDSLNLGNVIVEGIIMMSATLFLLPLRSAWFTLLYKTYDAEKTDDLRKKEGRK